MNDLVKDKYEKQHLANLNKYSRAIKEIYTLATQEAGNLTTLVQGFDQDKVFAFKDYPLTTNRIQKLLSKLNKNVETVILNGIDTEWTLANNKNSVLSQRVFGRNIGKLTQEQYRRYFSNNDEARKAFIARKTQGLNLSDRVWKYTTGFKSDIELGLDVGIRNGLDAPSMARQLRYFLNHPDELYRRVRNQHGYLVPSKSMSDFHPGTGVYRSSYKNSLRLTRTETNMAYRTADYERMQQLDFVVGIEILLSNNHLCNDICDDLSGHFVGDPRGKYPKDFKFTGWHPQCRCHVISILKTPEELMIENRAILNGEEPSHDSVNAVTTIPQPFQDWVKARGEKIASVATASLPYFLADNSGIIDHILHPAPTLKEIADLRHANRTPEQIQAIKDNWAQRQKDIADFYDDVKSILSYKFPEEDYKALREALKKAVKTKNLNIIKPAYEKLNTLKKAYTIELKKLEDLIPNVHIAHWDFTLQELQECYKSIQTKMKYLENLSLSPEGMVKKLKFEIDFLEEHKKYATWKVAQGAYKYKLKAVQYSIDLDKLKAQGTIVTDYLKAHKSKAIQALWDEVQGMMDKQMDIDDIQEKLSKALSEVQKKTAGKLPAGSPFKPSDYTKDRKDKAVWAKSPKEADNILRVDCGEIWNGCTEVEKDAIYGYTVSYHNINEPLRGLTYYGPKESAEQGLSRIPHIENIINRTKTTHDMWVQRGDGMVSLKKFGLSNYNTATDEEIKALVGKEGVEGAFCSAGVAKGKGMPGSVIYNIYMPKGTKAMYCEPFSFYGLGGRRYWDGISKQTKFGDESEILIQRGTKFRITKVQKKDDQWFIDIDIIDQHPVPFPYKNGYPFL